MFKSLPLLLKRMSPIGYETLKASFFKAFANVPAPLREEIIVAITGETFTWYTANAEIEHDTAKAKKIIEQLQKMKVI